MRYVGPVILVIALLAVLASEATAAPRCYEDEPCWRWPKMGNHHRGVVLNTPTGEETRRAILAPCEFAYYDWMGWIDWQRTERLRGDRWARRHGCEVPAVALTTRAIRGRV